MKRNTLLQLFGGLITLLCVIALTGCTHTVKVEPIKVEPIDITLHIYLKADEKLDSFFDYQDEQPVQSPAASLDVPTGATS